jgi:hypothetical protein
MAWTLYLAIWRLYLAIWGALAVSVVVGLAVYRKLIRRCEDDSLHVSGDGPAIEEQKFNSYKLEAIGLRVKMLTVVIFVLSLVLLTIYGYISWEASLRAA